MVHRLTVAGPVAKSARTPTMHEQTLTALSALQAAQRTYTEAVAKELDCGVEVVELLRRISALDDAHEVASGGAEVSLIVNETSTVWQHSPEKLRAAAQVALYRLDGNASEFSKRLTTEFEAVPNAVAVLRGIAAGAS